MRKLKSLSIKTKYVLILTLCVALPVFLLGMWLLNLWIRGQEVSMQRNTINQMRLTGNTVDSFLQQYEKLAYDLSGDEAIVSLLQKESSLSNTVIAWRRMNEVITTHETVRSIQIFKDQETVMSTGMSTLQTQDEHHYYQRLFDTGINRKWGPVHSLTSFFKGSFDAENLLLPYYSRIYTDGRYTEQGMLALYLDAAAFEAITQTARTEETQQFWIITPEGDLLLPPYEGFTEWTDYRPDSGEAYGVRILGRGRNKQLFYWSRCGFSDCCLCKIEKGNSLWMLQLGSVGLFLILLILIVGSSLMLHARLISRPISRLSREMDACIDERAEKLNTVTVYEQEDEIGKLTRASNHMICRINDLIDTVYVEQIETARARLDLIGAQINPHFLFNTIDSIHWTALANGDQDVGEQLEVLSDFLREMLNFGVEDITIAQELHIIDSYCYLLQKRYMGTMRLIKKVDPDLLDCRISKLLIQPLVENCFTHGMEKDPGRASIWLTIREKNRMLQIYVMDNGLGCDGKKVRQEMEGKEGKEYFALRNIRQRLRLKYGEEGKLHFYGIPGKGTLVRLEQPIVRE